MLIPETLRKKLITNLLEGIKKQPINPEFDIIYRSENMLLVVPKTRAAACKYGEGTKWCSADPNIKNEHWGSFERVRQNNILFYLILYKDTPEGKVEDYKISIEKKIGTGAEVWNDIGGKRIFNMGMFKKFILTDPNVNQKIIEYWKSHRSEWRPKFQPGDYVEPINNYGNTTFTDTRGRGEIETSWDFILCIAVKESKAKLLVQIVRPSMYSIKNTSDWAKRYQEPLAEAFENHWILQKWVNPYRFRII